MCGVGSQVCTPASIRVTWPAGTVTPFTGLSSEGFSIDLSNPQLQTAIMRVGAQSTNLTALATNPEIVPFPQTEPITALSTFAPQYSVGNPVTSSITPTSTTDIPATALSSFATFFSWVNEVNSTMKSTNSAVQFQARGFYNASNNTFTATTINLVL
jgi:hypothetical protein